jgi:hypothetical protein
VAEHIEHLSLHRMVLANDLDALWKVADVGSVSSVPSTT